MSVSVYCNTYLHQTLPAPAVTQLHMLLTGTSVPEPATQQHPSTQPHSSCVITLCISSISKGGCRCACCPCQSQRALSSTVTASWTICCRCCLHVYSLPSTAQGFKCRQAACFCCCWACHGSRASAASSSTSWFCSTRQASSGFSYWFETERAKTASSWPCRTGVQLNVIGVITKMHLQL